MRALVPLRYFHHTWINLLLCDIQAEAAARAAASEDVVASGRRYVKGSEELWSTTLPTGSPGGNGREE